MVCGGWMNKIERKVDKMKWDTPLFLIRQVSEDSTPDNLLLWIEKQAEGKNTRVLFSQHTYTA